MSSVAHLNRQLGALPAVAGNSAELFPDYVESIAAMAAAVDTAERFVHVEFYITAWDETTDGFFAALVRATERGVPVRMLFDHLGSRGIPGYKQTLARLRETEIDWHRMLPIAPLKGKIRRLDLRNHRKILVVDGTVAFTGSQNLIEPGYDEPKNRKIGRAWVELIARVEGPVVAALNAVFATDWFSETDECSRPRCSALAVPILEPGRSPAQVLPSGPGFATENNLRMFTTLIYSAAADRSPARTSCPTSPCSTPSRRRRSVGSTSSCSSARWATSAWSTTPSVVLPGAARGRGADLPLPGPHVLHSKHFTIDDDVAVIGSSNMDLRSFALNYEVSLMMLGTDIVGRMREVEDSYRGLSRELTAEEWARRPAARAYVDNVMRLTAALQ